MIRFNSISKIVIIAFAVLICAGNGATVLAAKNSCVKPLKDYGDSHGKENINYLVAEGPDITCYPAVIHAPEKNWTFLLRGADAIWVEKAILVEGDKRYSASNIEYPSTAAAIIDFSYEPLDVGASAELVLTGGGKEIYRFQILVTEGHKVAEANRQPDRVRVQMAPSTILYPLHGFRGERNQVPERYVSELDGDPDFLACLTDLNLPSLRKVMSRYAEDDSMHWDDRFERYNHYRGKQLRQYIMHLDPGKSEAAYKEIFLGFPGVELAFVNEDKNKKRKKK
jgi:hypothetical protein